MIATLLAAAVFSFGGGKENSFATSLSKEFAKPVAILVDPDTYIAAKAVKYTSDVNLPNYFASKFGLVAGDSKALGFGKPFWPDGFFRKQNDHKYRSRIHVSKDSKLTEANGKITIELGAEGALPLTRLKTLPSLRGLAWHWFYDSAMIVASCKNAEPQDLLKAVAGALGAKLTVKSEKPYFDIDPTQLRKRGIALMAKPIAGDGYARASERANRAYYAELLAVSTDAQIRKAYGEYGSNVEFVIPKSTRLLKLALARIDVAAAFPDETGSAIQRLVESVDADKPVLANLSSDGHIAAIYGSKRPHVQHVF